VGWLPSCDRSRDGGVFKSSDAGYTWQQKVQVSDKENLAQADILCVKLDPLDSQTVYLGVKGKGLYKSLDAGETWQRILPVDSDIYGIAIDPKDSRRVYVAALAMGMGKIYFSPNAFEETIEEILVDPKSDQALKDVAVDGYDSQKLYTVSVNGGIYKSFDGGKSWAVKFWAPDKLNRLRLSPLDSRVIYVSTETRGLLKSIDGGETWSAIEEPIQKFAGGARVHDLVVLNNDTVFLATDYGLLKSTDGGNSWAEIRTLIEPREVPINVLAVPEPSTIYFAAASSMHWTVNGGQTWTDWLIPTARQISTLNLDPQDSQVMYVGTLNVKK
jgi:photosystem II stability/assembly factor-like uncharacterized protein